MGDFMPTYYKTSDGNSYDYETEARQHQDYLDGNTPYDYGNDNSKATYIYNNLASHFNSANWNLLIHTFETLPPGDKTILNRYFNAKLNYLLAIARANTDNNFEKAFIAANWGNYKPQNQWGDPKELYLFECTMKAGKEAFKRKNGREITEAELSTMKNQYDIDFLESFCRKNVEEDGYFYESKIVEWENLTGKQMTKEEMIRITGRIFDIADNNGNILKRRSKNTSGKETSSSGGFKKFIIIGIIMIAIIFIAPRVLSFFVSATSGKSTSTTQTLTATITSACNFRVGSSTDHEVIKQLQQGDIVTMTGKTDGGWSQVTHNGDTGWVSTQFLGK